MAENPRISVFYNVHSACSPSGARQAPIARHGEKETHLVPLPFAVDSVQFCTSNVNRKAISSVNPQAYRSFECFAPGMEGNPWAFLIAGQHHAAEPDGGVSVIDNHKSGNAGWLTASRVTSGEVAIV